MPQPVEDLSEDPRPVLDPIDVEALAKARKTKMDARPTRPPRSRVEAKASITSHADHAFRKAGEALANTADKSTVEPSKLAFQARLAMLHLLQGLLGGNARLAPATGREFAEMLRTLDQVARLLEGKSNTIAAQAGDPAAKQERLAHYAATAEERLGKQFTVIQGG